jgi:WD40 repeat protein
MATQSMAQTPDCSEKDYNRLMAEAKRLAEKGLYDKAIDKLQSAKVCQPTREREVNEEVVRVFREVNRQRELAVENEQKFRSSALINEAELVYENTNKSIALLEEAYRNDPSNDMVLGTLNKTLYNRSFNWNGKTFTAPIFADLYVSKEETQVHFAHSTDDGKIIAMAFAQKCVLLNSNAQPIIEIGQDVLGKGEINQIRVSNKGKYLAISVTQQGQYKVLIYEMGTRSLKWLDCKSILGKSSIVKAMEFSPNENELALACREKIAIWNVADSNLVGANKTSGFLNDTIYKLHFWPNGKNILLVTPDTIKNWNIKNNSISPVFANQSSYQKRIGYLDAIFVPGTNNYLVLLDLRGAKVTRFNGNHFSGHLSLVRLGDSQLGELIYKQDYEQQETYSSISFLPCGILAAASVDDNVYLFNCFTEHQSNATIQFLIRLVGHTHDVGYVCQSANGKGVFSFSLDNTVKYWNIFEHPLEKRVFKSLSPIKTVERWNISAFSPTYKYALFFDNEDNFKCYDFSLDQIKPLSNQTYEKITAPIMMWLDDSNAVIAHNDFLIEYNAQSGHLDSLKLGYPISDLWIEQASKQFWAIAGGKIYKVQKQRAQLIDGYNLEKFISYNEKTKTLMVSRTGEKPILFDIKHKKFKQADLFLQSTSIKGPPKTLNNSKAGANMIVAYAFSNDFRYVALCGEDVLGGSISLVNQKTGKKIILNGHTEKISSIDFSDNGHFLITASWDKTVRVWNLSGKEIIKMEFDGVVEYAEFIRHDRMFTVLFAPDPSLDRTTMTTNPTLNLYSFSKEEIFKK